MHSAEVEVPVPLEVCWTRGTTASVFFTHCFHCNAPLMPHSAEVEVPVPLEVCWTLWDDRERIPQWMPWIKSVKVLPEDSRLSRWTLSTHQFGR